MSWFYDPKMKWLDYIFTLFPPWGLFWGLYFLIDYFTGGGTEDQRNTALIMIGISCWPVILLGIGLLINLV